MSRDPRFEEDDVDRGSLPEVCIGDQGRFSDIDVMEEDAGDT